MRRFQAALRRAIPPATLALAASGCLLGFDPPVTPPVPDFAFTAPDFYVAPPPPPDFYVAPPDIVALQGAVPGTAPDGGVGDGGADQSARGVFIATVKPLLDQDCAGCHAALGGVGPSFLKPDSYDSLLAWPGMITRDPSHSLLITKGPHDGNRFFTDNEKLIVYDWLAIESRGLTMSVSSIVATPPVPVVDGDNSIFLDALGKDFLGARVSFTSARNGQVLKITGLTAWASGPSGLHIVHPLFVGVLGGVRTPDPIDNFNGIDAYVAHTANRPLGNGLLFITNVPNGAGLSLAFESVTRWDGLVQKGGCKKADQFTLFARPAIMNAGCDSKCHGGNDATAKNALDLSQLADASPAAQAAACAQTLNRVDPVTPDQSQIFGVTDPATSASHRYRFVFPDQPSFDAFKMAASQWVTQEQ